MTGYMHKFKMSLNLKLWLIKKILFFVKDEDVVIKFKPNHDKTFKLVFYKGLDSKIGDKVGS